MYSLLRRFLFSLPPEVSHDFSLDMLGAAERCGLMHLASGSRVWDPINLMGIEFPNRVGLAAGLDKNADYFNALGHMGFGFVEVGTVTPRAQLGNAKPRMFRIPEAEAIINRMGFNNKGVEYLVRRVKKRRFDGVLGINIGKNFDTPAEDAVSDYLACMEKVYEHADYISINISSPNTPGLRDLQFGDQLRVLLFELKKAQQRLSEINHRHVPLAVKIAPDMAQENIEQCAEMFRETKIEAVIATNTTVSREAVAGMPHSEEAGGLSGAPLTQSSTEFIRSLSQCLEGEIPIIGVGGILTPQDALDKLDAGASLVQIYTGFIYQGPSLIKQAAAAIAAR